MVHRMRHRRAIGTAMPASTRPSAPRRDHPDPAEQRAVDRLGLRSGIRRQVQRGFPPRPIARSRRTGTQGGSGRPDRPTRSTRGPTLKATMD
jgi:hypothetical protein